MKVQANREYIYYPNLMDMIDGRTALVPGSIVTVMNLPGCPPANTMQHAHVYYNGKFAGLVHVNSLHSLKDRQMVIDQIKKDMAAKEAEEAQKAKADQQLHEVLARRAMRESQGVL